MCVFTIIRERNNNQNLYIYICISKRILIYIIHRERDRKRSSGYKYRRKRRRRLAERMKKAQAAEMKKRKLNEEELSCCCSSSLVMLKRHRKDAHMEENSDDLCASPSSDHALSHCSSSYVGNEKLSTVDLQEEDGEEEALSTTYSIEPRQRRETFASSNLQTEATKLESTTVRNSEENSLCRATAVKMPSDAELEQFFSAAEKDLQEKFAEKYNFDIEKEEPFEGRFTWIRVKR